MTIQPMLLTIKINDVRDVDEIHVRAFPKCALSRLGKETVRRYKEWQMIGPHDLVATGAYLMSCDNDQAIRFYQSQGWVQIPSDEGIWKGKMRKFFAEEHPL